jgi:hypothetical protein
MARIAIARLIIAERVADKLWSHGIIPDQVDAVLFGRHVVGRNRSGRAAPYLLIGRDEQNRCLTVPIVPTDDPLVWRVVTAWYCKPDEAAKLRQWRRIMEQPIRYRSPQEPLDDEERELMDPKTWDWDDPVEVIVTEDFRVQLPIEITHEEHRLLARTARAAGLTPHEFIKRAALDAVHATRT